MVRYAALIILSCLIMSSSSAMAGNPPAAVAPLPPGLYRVTSIDAWSGHVEHMLNARTWEKIEVRADGERRLFVIHYKGGRTSTFDLRPSGPTAPAIWRGAAFNVAVITNPNGGTRLRMHFCYRGFIHLEKAAASAAP